MGSVFVFCVEGGKRPLWWNILAGIWLVGTGIGAFYDFRRLKNKIPVFLGFFVLGTALVYLGDIGRRPLWWNILAGFVLIGNGIGAFSDFHRGKTRNDRRIARAAEHC
ncbi:MAG: hypothetical protein B5766_05890 [Candidatus Lumbricidophila eiseniae]|uniref:Uncharacterized protein n=1 Tax=Candidatus Lumbricidiphila eiseniae TaxID=1969409 RepID=A0A2A6FRD8_9MICO|nr:MAG: hypothetical protein B5766_05890 [Candidatus Lumbricidophila eiseniae]